MGGYVFFKIEINHRAHNLRGPLGRLVSVIDAQNIRLADYLHVQLRTQPRDC